MPFFLRVATSTHPANKNDVRVVISPPCPFSIKRYGRPEQRQHDYRRFAARSHFERVVSRRVFGLWTRPVRSLRGPASAYHLHPSQRRRHSGGFCRRCRSIARRSIPAPEHPARAEPDWFATAENAADRSDLLRRRHLFRRRARFQTPGGVGPRPPSSDRKSTRLNSSH